MTSGGTERYIPEEIERRRVLFEQTWGQSNAPSIEQLLDEMPKTERSELLRELLYIEFEFLQRNAAELLLEQYLMRFSEHESVVREVADAVGQYTVFKRRNIAGYTLLGELGRGGMGVVYKAKSDFLNTLVAFKMVNHRMIDNPESLRRFTRELEMIGRLKHPNIVEAKHAGVAPDGSSFLVMELVEGMTLNQWSQQNPPPKSVAAPEPSSAEQSDILPASGISERNEKQPESSRIIEACTIIRDAARGLQAIHEAGLVHRDIKPGNIMLLEDGQVKILDLGLAKLREQVAENTRGFETQTFQGHFLGTPGYMAPEQMHSAAHVDIRADIYSLGCTLFFLLYGRAPAENKPKELPASLPKKLRTILDRMLAADPATRFQEPREIVAALDAFLCPPKMSRLGKIVAAAIVVFTCIAFVYFVSTDENHPLPAPPPDQGEQRPSFARLYAEAVAALPDELPLRRFIELIEQTELELLTKDDLDLRLYALEQLINQNANADRKTLSKDLRSLDVILLTPYPDADSCVRWRRFFDLAIRHCDPTDYDQLVKYVRRSRSAGGRTPSPQGATLVLFYFSPLSPLYDDVNFVIYYPTEREESQRRFELPFNRAAIKEAIIRKESLPLNDELVELLRQDVGAGVPIVLSWDDTACWSERQNAFSNEDWAFKKSISLEEILGQMK